MLPRIPRAPRVPWFRARMARLLVGAAFLLLPLVLTACAGSSANSGAAPAPTAIPTAAATATLIPRPTSTVPAPTATHTIVPPTRTPVPSPVVPSAPPENSAAFRSGFISWSSILASFIKYCQLATGEQVWSNLAMSLHDFMVGGGTGWNTP